MTDIEPMPGAQLAVGRIRLDTSDVELDFNRGAASRLGPSRFELKDADLLRLYSGNLGAGIPVEAIGFTITTDETKVVEFGTGFRARVGNDRQTEANVTEGPVEDLRHSFRWTIRIRQTAAALRLIE